MTDSAAQKANLATVKRLCEGWPSFSLGDFKEAMTPDCVYLNIPIPEARCIGPEQTYNLLHPFTQRARIIELRMIHMVGDNKVVMTERLERSQLLSGNSQIVELPVTGIFELENGRISHWRDYFDLRHLGPLIP
jgi:limonene-1,2-epoxide hydrolase